jgi:glycine cleavage system H protein
MSVPANLYYTQDHEWVRDEGNKVYVGITDHAQSELGDIVFVELPDVGTEFKKGAVLANVESVKAVGEVYAPVDGVVESVNEALADSPQLLNEAPYETHIAVLTLAGEFDASGLLNAAQYEEYLEENK